MHILSFLLAATYRQRRPRVLESAGIQVVGQVGDADRLLAQVRADRPDAVVVDIRMPPTHTSEGLDAARRIRGEHAPVGVLVLSQYVEPHRAMQLLEDGASGVDYLLKDRVANVGEVVEAVRRVAGDGSVIDPEVVAQLVGRRRTCNPIQELTERERQVLALMARKRAPQPRLGRATRVPHRTDNHGTERTTTVNGMSVMAWPLASLLLERIPRICLIRMRSPVQAGLLPAAITYTACRSCFPSSQ